MNPRPISAFVDGSSPPDYASLLGGVGVVLRDAAGDLLTLSRPVSPRLPIHYLEALAVLTALEVAEQLGVLWIIIHCDCSHAIAQLTEVCPPAPGLEDVNRRVQEAMRRFCWVSLVWISREENERAHGLARVGTHMPWDVVWFRGQSEGAS